MSKHLIDLVDIRKTYGEDDALKNINLYIRDGEFLTLLGPSGCGKTTMLRLIAGFTMPTEGKILIDGKDVSAVPPFKRRVNTVFQKYALFPHLYVYDNGAFGLKKGVLHGDILLNLDSEEEGELYVGCAGGVDANITFKYKAEPTPARNYRAVKLVVKGLKGGHSGNHIVEKRPNANK